MQIYLASASPRRQELLTQIGVAFHFLPQNIVEDVVPGESPVEHANRLALAKAEAGWQSSQRTENLPVLGADTVVVVDNIILGKPKDQADAMKMLALLSGRTHEVITAIALVKGERAVTKTSISRVTFRVITAEEAEAYWHTREPADKAGGYAIQGRGAIFIQHIEGSYSGIMGLPVYETFQVLQGF